MAYVGICPEASVYLQLYDGLFPRRGEPGFEESVRLIINELGDFEPDTVVMPMLTHDQPDLLATWEILQEALRRFASSIRVIEYALLTSDTHVSKPTAEHKVWRLDVKEVLDKKVKALQRFQRSRDAIASVLDTIHPWETYVEYQ